MIPQMLITVGVICFLYFVVMLIKRVDFGFIWLPISGAFLGLGSYLKNPEMFQIPNMVLIIGGMAAAIALMLFFIVETRIIKEMYRKSEPDLEYVILLGAQVKSTVPSKALKRRLEAAREYLEENPRTKAVLSGGQGPGEDITEAECMYRYLVNAAIEPNRLLLENRSTTTLENLRYSGVVISEDVQGNAYERKIGILSNNFHVYRAMRLGKKMGYRDFYGIAARSDWHLQVHYLVREFFALVKEKINGNI